MNKTQLNLYVNEDVRVQFDELVEASGFNRPSYFTLIIKQEYRRLMAARNKETQAVRPEKALTSDWQYPEKAE